jgi:hypothetical protein
MSQTSQDANGRIFILYSREDKSFDELSWAGDIVAVSFTVPDLLRGKE